jgi:hypothetical protein
MGTVWARGGNKHSSATNVACAGQGQSVTLTVVRDTDIIDAELRLLAGSGGGRQTSKETVRTGRISSSLKACACTFVQIIRKLPASREDPGGGRHRPRVWPNY